MVYGAPGSTARTATVDVAAEDRRRFSITDLDIIELAKQALIIEEHYGCPMDIEWGKDGETGKIYILQARPETVQSRAGRTVQRFALKKKSKVLATGRSIGQRIGAGPARIIRDVKEMTRVQSGDVLVADMTDPDWEPVMKRAAAIVTNRGGRTCHAAIIARELGIPAVVGCTDATETILEGAEITVSCAEGDTGFVYEGALPFEQKILELDSLPPIPTKIMMNVGNPDRAFDFAGIPHRGVGLARLEFIINRMIGVHPRALLEFDQLQPELQQTIQRQMSGYGDPVSFYVEKLCEGISTIAAAFAPEPVIVRLSDFKSNEYANLIGGRQYEPHEENPMLGFRGASRYVDEAFRPCFELECRALKRVREQMGLTNVQIMVPFVRTVKEAEQVTTLLADERPEARRERSEDHHDVRAAHQRTARRAIPGILRRHVDRLERHDAADARAGPRLGNHRQAVRRARRSGQGAAQDGDRRLPQARQVHRHLRPGSVGSPRFRALAARAEDREHLAESRHSRGNLAVPGRDRGQVAQRCPDQQAVVGGHRVLAGESQPVLASQRLQRLVVAQSHLRITLPQRRIERLVGFAGEASVAIERTVQGRTSPVCAARAQRRRTSSSTSGQPMMCAVLALKT